MVAAALQLSALFKAIKVADEIFSLQGVAHCMKINFFVFFDVCFPAGKKSSPPSSFHQLQRSASGK